MKEQRKAATQHCAVVVSRRKILAGERSIRFSLAMRGGDGPGAGSVLTGKLRKCRAEYGSLAFLTGHGKIGMMNFGDPFCDSQTQSAALHLTARWVGTAETLEEGNIPRRERCAATRVLRFA